MHNREEIKIVVNSCDPDAEGGGFDQEVLLAILLFLKDEGYERVMAKAGPDIKKWEYIYVRGKEQKLKRMKEVVEKHFEMFDAMRPSYELVEKNGVLWYKERRVGEGDG